MKGATKAGYKYYQLLEIKHMQYDSLGYLQCWPLLYSGQYSFAVHLLDNTLKFFNINYKEAADQLTHAYKYGSFEKINEFLNFRERLKNSFHHSLVTIEHSINNLIHLPSHELTIQSAQNLSINPEKPIANLDHLVDNRDLYIFLNFDSDSKRMNEKYAKLSFEHEVSLLRLRTTLLRCVGASINASLFAQPVKLNEITNNKNNHAHRNGIDEFNSKYLDVFINIIKELRELFKSFLENPPEEIPKSVFSGTELSHLFTYLKSSFFLPLFIDAMSFAHEFCSHCLANSSTEEQVERIAEISANAFAKLIFECNAKILTIQTSYNDIDHREVFKFFSLVIEIVCVMSIICGNLHSVLVASSKKAVTPARRKKKKGKESAATLNTANEDNNKEQIEGSVLKIFTYYLSIVRDNIRTLDIHLSHLELCWTELETHKSRFELRRWPSHDNNKLNVDPNLGISDQRWFQIQADVNECISDSYRSSIKQFRNIVKHKVEYLSLLSFN